MKVILLSGGSGLRLWPLSNDIHSKQYIKILEDKSKTKKISMLQRVFFQLSEVGLYKNSIIVASEPQKEIIHSQLQNEIEIAIEPEKRDTFPAVLVGVSYLYKLGIDDDEPVVVMPVDPYADLSYFSKLLELDKVLEEGHCDLVLMGVKPTYPSAKYGYILSTEATKQYAKVKSFKEKPTEEEAESLIRQGALWNCGVFCFRAGFLKKYIEKYKIEFDYDEIVQNYEKLPKISFDYEVVESSENKAVVEYRGEWKDIGTWNTLTEEMSENSIGDVEMDAHSKGTKAINMLDIPMIVMGARELIVAATYDGILVAERERSSYLKDSLSKIKAKPRYEERRWGSIKTIDKSEEDGVGVCTNKIKVEAGKNTSFHKHNEHIEIITIISGEGYLVKEDSIIKLSRGLTITINRGEFHAIRADSVLVYIEVLMGNLERDDVTRTIFEWDEIVAKYFKEKE